MTQAPTTGQTSALQSGCSREAARTEQRIIARASAIIAALLLAVGAALAAFGALELSGLALFGGMAAAVASAAQRPRRVTGWIGVAVLAATLICVAVRSVS